MSKRTIAHVLFALVALHLCDPSFALTFRRVAEQTVEATGEIELGDTSRLAAQIAAIRTDGIGRPNFGLILNSPGGSLVEGLRLGQFLREKAIYALVRRGDVCYSACAIAFLGGTQAAEIDSGIGRYLEVGAKLGFHGFSTTAERVMLANEAFDSARLLYGVLLAYAAEMQNIDLSLFSALLSVRPTSIRVVNTPRELDGLGIVVRGQLPPRPAAWARNACLRHVAKARPIKDGPIEERVPPSQMPQSAANPAQLRRMLLRPDPITPDPLARLPAEVLVELAFVWEPTYPVHRVSVVRGRSFYYDYCFAHESSTGVQTLLLDTNFTKFEARQQHGLLSVYAEDTQLWRP